MHVQRIIFLIITCFAFSRGEAVADAEYRYVALENGLKVILIADPSVPLSAASLTVGAGTLCNPPDKQGLAHFVEHLLFQGSKKYSRPGEFQNYIIRNSGYYYAETNVDCTNYGFQIRNGAFEEAFDRFADCFNAPLMAKKTIPTELKIIEEEFQKFSTSDVYTVASVKARFYKEGHPLKNMLPGGNAETLKSTTQKDARLFFSNYYRPDIMTLVVMASRDLDGLENLVRRSFSPLKSGKSIKIPEYKNFIDEKNSLEVVRIATKNNYKILYLDFAVESEKDDWKGRPAYLIRTLLESDAPGSLLALLKKEGLALGLKVFAGNNAKATTGTGWCISITLTDRGYDEYKRVLNMFFSEICLLKNSEFPSGLFEKKKISSVADADMARKLSGINLTKKMALSLQAYPAELLIDLNFIHCMEKSETTYYKVLEQIRPSRMIVSLLTPDLRDGLTEPHYGTLYAVDKESADFYNGLLDPGKYESLYMPKFDIGAEQSDAESSVAPYADHPICLVKDANKSLFLIRNNIFGGKRIAMRLRLSLPDECVSIEGAAKSQLLVSMLNESMSTWIGQEAGLTGVKFLADSTPNRLTFEISGLNERVRMAVAVMERFMAAPDQGKFYEAVKANLVSSYKNYHQQDAYIKAWEYYTSISEKSYWRYQDYVPFIEAATGRDVAAFARTLRAKAKWEAVIYGDIAEDAVREIFENLIKTAPYNNAVNGTYSKHGSLKILPGENLIFWETHAPPSSGLHIAYHNIGDSSPEDMVASMVLGKFISGAIHTKLCIEEKIAYVATAYSFNYIDESHAYIDIQSNQLSADQLLSKTDSMLLQLPAMFEHISDDHWRDIVEGVRDEISRRPLFITEAVRRSFDIAFERGENWGWNDTLIMALHKTTKQDVAKLLKEAFGSEARRRIVVVESGNTQMSSRYKTITYSLEDMKKWKTTRIYE